MPKIHGGGSDIGGVPFSKITVLTGEMRTGALYIDENGNLVAGTGTQILDPANENVAAGYYAVTTLSAVDGDLAAANIRSGVMIFGFTGPATVQEIGASDALVGNVMDTVTFFSVTGGIKTGTMPTVALAAGSSAYPAGYHAGEGGGLVAVDGDFVAGNIKNGVVIFDVTGTLVELELVDYHHYEDLAAGANYVPTAQTEGLFIGEDVGNVDLHFQFEDGWVDQDTVDGFSGYFAQDNAQNIRIINADGAAAWKIGFTGRRWVAGFTDYRHYEDLASGVDYVPTARSTAMFLGEITGDADLTLELFDGGGWRTDNLPSDWWGYIAQDNSQNMRIKNSDPGALKISLTGVIW